MRQLELKRPEDREWLRQLREQTLANPQVREDVARILERVRREGDEAVRAYTRELDRASPPWIRVPEEELHRLAAACDPELREVLERAAENIRAFHAPQMPSSYELGGGRLRQRVIPLSIVGLYVPGGRAAYPSTVLMSAVPARVAGVRRICVATPPQAQGPLVSPAVAAACAVAGVTDLFVMGGAQAIGAFAYGTASVPRVDKVCGPGNAWVAEAKRQLAGRVGIDMLAGPSEVTILDDGRADPSRLAYDLLAQAEHDPLAVPLCVTTSRRTWETLPATVAELLRREPNPVAAQSMEGRGAVILAGNLDEAVDFVNELAPEHLELEADPALAERITTAGALFVGTWSCEPVGDYLAGPNHTLPTGGSARFASALGVYDFVRRVHEIRWTEEDLRREGPSIAHFARAEGLIAHARAVETRLEAKGDAAAHRADRSVASYVLPSVRRQRAYTLTAPPEAPVKLNQNEAPEDLPEAVKERLLARFRQADWRRYPPFHPTGLKARIAQVDGWREEGVLIGNGSNELLTLLFRSVVGPGDTVVRPDPCFSLYPLHLDVAGARQIPLVLREADGFAYHVDELLAAARTAKVVLLCSPNNPTGSVLPRGAVERLLSDTAALVVVDEAYREWCGQDLAPLLGPNVPLVLLRTCSKALAMAGLRFGYLLGPPNLCAELDKVTLPYSVNTFTQIAAAELLPDRKLIQKRLELVQAERARVSGSLRAKGRKVVEGGANFILFSSANPPSEFARLLQRGVLIRDLSKAVPGYLRASIGTPAENDRLLENIEA